MLFNDFLQEYQQRIHQRLEVYLPAADTLPHDLHQAMRYVTLNGGKRLRALLIYATGLALDVEPEALDPAAAAVEMVHAYSLVHDDLPAMDDDDWRRGKPSCHKAFNEALAILVGDALQSLAFATLAAPTAFINPTQQIAMIAKLAQAIGSTGMAGGQALDLAAEQQKISREQVDIIHRYKTGALIVASMELAILTRHPPISFTQARHLHQFADRIGLAFQIRDDILNVEGDAKILGKTPGSDAAHHKATYPALIGMTQAKAYVATLYQQAIHHLQQAQIASTLLQDLAEWIVHLPPLA